MVTLTLHGGGYPALMIFSKQQSLFDLGLHLESWNSNTAAMPSTHDKEKPWDTDDIDKWKVSKFSPPALLGP